MEQSDGTWKGSVKYDGVGRKRLFWINHQPPCTIIIVCWLK